MVAGKEKDDRVNAFLAAYKAREYDKGNAIWDQIVENGTDMEQYRLGLYCMDELEGVDKDCNQVDIEEAAILFEKAAAQGNRQAKAILEKWDRMEGSKYDYVEDTKYYRAIKKELEALIESELKYEKRGRGFCHVYWKVKQMILKQEYGIKWKSPLQLNPGTLFD